MNAIVATTSWNCLDLISSFLTHYQRLGFQRALVMDFNSVDGTREVLTSDEWKAFVVLEPFPGIAGLDSSNLLLATAKRSFSSDCWCLFCDPDEFLITPSMTIVDLSAHMSRHDSCVLPRFNVTAERSIAQFDQNRLTAQDALTLRIDRQHQRTIEPQALMEPLDPPWIFTAIPGKAFVSIDAAIAIGDGDHTAATAGPMAPAPYGVHLLHYPFRSFRSFTAKIQLAERDFAANHDLPPTYGWQLRRWIQFARRGQLFDEYLCQFVPDQDVERLLQDGTLVREWRIATRRQRV
jgi:hypothetical protein